MVQNDHHPMVLIQNKIDSGTLYDLHLYRVLGVASDWAKMGWMLVAPREAQ